MEGQSWKRVAYAVMAIIAGILLAYIVAERVNYPRVSVGACKSLVID